MLRDLRADRGVVGQVAVVDDRLLQAGERMRHARVPDEALGGEAVVADPDPGPKLLKPVAADHVVVPDQLQDQQVPALGEDEGALPPARA